MRFRVQGESGWSTLKGFRIMKRWSTGWNAEHWQELKVTWVQHGLGISSSMPALCLNVHGHGSKAHSSIWVNLPRNIIFSGDPKKCHQSQVAQNQISRSSQRHIHWADHLINWQCFPFWKWLQWCCKLNAAADIRHQIYNEFNILLISVQYSALLLMR